MNNPVPYRFYTENDMFEKERDEHGEVFQSFDRQDRI